MKTEAEHSLSDNAIVVQGETLSGKPCRIVDNTGTISEAELRQLLEQLVEQNEFGIKGLSDGQGIMKLGEPRLAHIQIEGDLYRLVLLPYEARIEKY